MTAAPLGDGDGVAELGSAECLRLMATDEIGRVVYTDGALPAIRPVTYAVDGRSVLFRVAAGSRLAAALEGAVVAFEVDQLDRDTRSGWSVVLTGVAAAVRDGSELTRATTLGIAPWAPGQRSHFVRVTPGMISGRRIGRGPAG